jgi:hypothetical protein
MKRLPISSICLQGTTFRVDEAVGECPDATPVVTLHVNSISVGMGLKEIRDLKQMVAQAEARLHLRAEQFLKSKNMTLDL